MPSPNRPQPPRDRAVEIQPNTLYALLDTTLATHGAPAIEVIGGVVNVYGSSVKPVSPPLNMVLGANGQNFDGISALGLVPNYLYVSTVSGTPTIRISNFIVEVAT